MSGKIVSQVKGEKMSHEVNPKQALRQAFTAINKEETVVNLTDTVGRPCINRRVYVAL